MLIKTRSLFLSVSITAILTYLTIVTYNFEQADSDYSYLSVSQLRSLYKNISISPDPCMVNDLVILVHSSITNRENREILRRFVPKPFKIIFVVGQSLESKENLEIRNETKKFGDILIGSFIDSYRNLTVKHLTGYEFITLHCRRASIILKIDDDIFVNFKKLEQYLNNEFPIKQNDPLNITDRVGYSMFQCFKIHRGLVVRGDSLSDSHQKWVVPRNIFKDYFYPDYCSGWAYLTTVGAIDITLDKLSSMTPEEPAFWIDDVYITGMLKDQFAISMEAINQHYCPEIEKLRSWINTSTSLSCIFGNTDSNSTLLKQLYKHSVKNSGNLEPSPIAEKQVDNSIITGIAEVSIKKLKR